MKRFILLSFLFLSFKFLAQQPAKPTAVELYEQIQKLNFLGSVLYIAAHPDDENTRLISYLSNEKKARTGYLSLTRGDGGQNLIGSEHRNLSRLEKLTVGNNFFQQPTTLDFQKTLVKHFKFGIKIKF